jgi:hypothetical protein
VHSRTGGAARAVLEQMLACKSEPAAARCDPVTSSGRVSNYQIKNTGNMIQFVASNRQWSGALEPLGSLKALAPGPPEDLAAPPAGPQNPLPPAEAASLGEPFWLLRLHFALGYCTHYALTMHSLCTHYALTMHSLCTR